MAALTRWLRSHPFAATALVAVTAAVVVDHWIGSCGDDWSRYDHGTFAATAVSGDGIQLTDGTPVQLLGVSDPTGDAAAWLARQLSGRTVTLLLPSTGTRDPAGRLVAYAFMTDDETCLNAALVRDGMAYADRRVTDPMAAALDTAEAEARRKRRGLWNGLRFEQMPPWRQAWLRATSATKR